MTTKPWRGCRRTAPQTNGRKAHGKPQGNAQQAFETKEYKFIPKNKNGSQAITEAQKKREKKGQKNNPLTNVSGNFLPFPFPHAIALELSAACSARCSKIL